VADAGVVFTPGEGILEVWLYGPIASNLKTTVVGSMKDLDLADTSTDWG